MALEPVSFAQEELSKIRNEVDQAFQSTPPNLEQCLKSESLVITIYLRFVKLAFEWKCNSGPGRTASTCTDWALAVDS